MVIGLLVVLAAFVPLGFVGCGSQGSGGGDGGGDVPSEVTTAAAILVAADPSSINPGQSTTIRASVYNQSGEGLENITVLFTLSDPTLAYVGSTSATNAQGTAETTLTARELSGTVSVTATYQEVTGSKDVIILDSTSPSTINLSVSPTAITVEGTATVTAQVLDANGDPVTNGTGVVFEVQNTAYGTVTASAVTNGGTATATFTAANQPGSTTITASSGSASASVTITIQGAPSASIEFVSAEPASIAIAETGGTTTPETSTIKFMVKDSNGNPVEGVNVSCEMVGPNGGEYIDTDDTPATLLISTGSDGIANVKLNSGYVAGPVTIYASITTDQGNTITVQSSVVSIGGGVPSMKWFSVSAAQLNIPGLEINNFQTDVSAYLADRFGNYNVLQGTTVSFASEVGTALLSSNVTLDEDGIATVTLRSQVSATVPSPEPVNPLSWETSLASYVNTTYGPIMGFTDWLTYSGGGYPRQGYASILVYAKGEEHFNDSNANGVYDAGVDSFTDTADDPFLDVNDDGAYDDASSADPEELYIDAGSNGVWDGTNGVWDENKAIFTNYGLYVTGSPIILFDTGSISLPTDGSTVPVKIIVCDRNLNPLSTGTRVSISNTVGALSGVKNFTFRNTNQLSTTQAGHLGFIEFSIAVFDSEENDSAEPAGGELKVTVEWENGTYESSIPVYDP